MKLIFPLSNLLALSSLSAVHSACLGTCDEVQANASCLDAFALGVGGEICQAGSVLLYGRYCGNRNNCDAVDEIPSGEEDSFCLAGSDACPPPACDPIDEACMTQGMCLDQLREDLNITGELG